ncbi:Serine aminopeptidase, S33 [Candidatus Burarchaeum australiense]|nr:Serine aminopeptidase, S33 [Candidatus Burarchaeum australiense]
MRSPAYAMIFTFLLALLLASGCLSSQSAPKQEGFAVSDYGVLSYPSERGEVQFIKAPVERGPGHSLSRISYASAGNVTIYGLLREVSGAPGTAAGDGAGNGGAQAEKAAIVLLPGAGRTKEQEQALAAVLAQMGYSSLSLDQRGDAGESKDVADGFDEQYAHFLKGEEIFEYERVYDALRAFDLLRQLGYRKIIFMGESMGGRYSIIAGALEPRSLGVVGISTSGYGFDQVPMQDANMTRFARSIDPDTYAPLIAPRRLAMLHSPNDPVIPLEAARSTYLRAHEPRAFIEVTCSDSEGNGLHGWCAAMNGKLEEELQKAAVGNQS